MKEKILTVGLLALIALFAMSVLALPFWALPKYSIWQKEQSGRAALAEAEWSKRVQVEEAKANLASEILNAQAEVERARGAAEAIKIEGGSLTSTYIQYLWVRQNKFNDKTTIYIPTEGNLPILEANRLK